MENVIALVSTLLVAMIKEIAKNAVLVADLTISAMESAMEHA